MGVSNNRWIPLIIFQRLYNKACLLASLKLQSVNLPQFTFELLSSNKAYGWHTLTNGSCHIVGIVVDKDRL